MSSTFSVPLVHFPSLAAFPGLVHAVSTRRGGVSQGPFASLNLGWTVGDDRANVETNTRRLAAALEVRREDFTTTWQVHGNRIVCATESDRGAMIGQADGIITAVPGLPLTQRYGDCTPLLVYDPRRHAIGLAHAGWRGTVVDVAGALVAAMVEAFGSDPQDLSAVIGPAIGPCCYEVGPEVVGVVQRAFAQVDGLLTEPSVQTRREDDGSASGPSRLHFDLWEANRRLLAQAGVGHVTVSGVCTRCHRDTYFSHRGDHGRTGRFGAVMMLRN